MDEQILLISDKRPDEMAEIAASGFTGCYAEKGKIYEKNTRKYAFKTAVFSWFGIFSLQIGLGIKDIINFDLSVAIIVSIVVATFIGCIPIFLHDKEFIGVYVAYSPDNKSTILIKYKNPDGTRRFDDDIIYHFIVYLRQKDSTLGVIE